MAVPNGGGPMQGPPKPPRHGRPANPKQRPPRPPRRGHALGKAAAGPVPALKAAQAEIDPVIAAITKAANDRAQRAEAAIKGYTDSYAHDIAGIDYGAPYAGAEAGQADVDAALRQALTGQGADLASGLSGRLAALAGTSGAGAVADTAHGLASQGASAGTTRLAAGSASLGDLIAQAAAAREYGTKMPGIAKLSGLQGVKQAEGNAQSEIAQGTTAAEERLPDITERIKADRQAARAAKSEAQYRAAELALSRDKAAAEIAQGDARIRISQQNANTSAYRAQTSAAHDAELERMALANYGLSAERLRLAQQKAVKIQRSGGLTANERGTMAREAQDFTKGLYEGVPGHVTYPNSTNGLTAPRIDAWKQQPTKYQGAIKLLIQRFPALGPKGAIKLANSFYRPGEGGRPMGKQPKLSQILGPPGGVAPPGSPLAAPTSAKPYKGHFAYLGPTQGVKGGFLQNVAAAARSIGATKIRITSGYRSPSHNAAVGGVSHSNHTTGDAIDGYAYIPGRGWVPLGVALLSVAGRYGLRSGDVPGFYHGGPDLVHVDDGANVR